MARLPRFVIPGQPQHVIQRGNNCQEIFYTNKEGIGKLMQRLGRYYVQYFKHYYKRSGTTLWEVVRY